MITNAKKFFDEDTSLTPEEKKELMKKVNMLDINNPVLNCKLKVPDRNGSLVIRNIIIYMHYPSDDSSESDGFIGKLVNA